MNAPFLSRMKAGGKLLEETFVKNLVVFLLLNVFLDGNEFYYNSFFFGVINHIIQTNK